jgi:FkbM family methyltransferase
MSRTKRPVAFVLASSNHGALIVNRNDYRMNDGGSVDGVGFQILTTSAFDPDEINTALELLAERRRLFGDGVVAVDCGANIGVHTVEWAALMAGWGSVISIEAQERIFYALAGNIALNNCFNASAILAAVGDHIGQQLVPRPDYLKPASYGSLELKQGNNEFIGQEIDYSEGNCNKVELITIDSLELERLDLLKIDVEGMELEVLNGAQKSIKKYKPQMIVESIKTDKTKLREWLHARGYRIFPMGINYLAIHSTDDTADKITLKP